MRVITDMGICQLRPCYVVFIFMYFCEGMLKQTAYAAGGACIGAAVAGPPGGLLGGVVGMIRIFILFFVILY